MESTDNIVSVFFTGHMAPSYYGSFYAGESGMRVRLRPGEEMHITKPSSKEMLPHIYTAQEMNDLSYDCTCSPCYFCSTCIQCLCTNMNGLKGVSEYPHNLWSRVNFGGEADVAQCVSIVRKCIKEHPKKNIVLFGMSKGASTVLVSLLSFTTEELERISLVVLEAPFTTLPTVLERLRYPVSWALTFLEWTTLYKRTQLSPLDAVKSESFPLNKPMLFITSKSDIVTPKEDVMPLIDVLKQRVGSSDHIHHLELAESPHASFAVYDEEDMELYYSKLHELYKTYCK